MATGSPQTPLRDDEDPKSARIFTFTWDAVTMALSRYRSRFFLVYVDGRYLHEPGKRIHSSLNVVSWHLNHHSKKGPKIASFWLNGDQRDGDSEDPNDILYQLFHADPPLVRHTGRKRKEASPDGGADLTVDCDELEVLVPEEGLIRQCYYCLSWEDNEHRYSHMKHDKYWCSKVRVSSKHVQFNVWLTEYDTHQCKKRGRFLSAITPKDRSDTRTFERESIYA